jgi:hypothetical protein
MHLMQRQQALKRLEAVDQHLAKMEVIKGALLEAQGHRDMMGVYKGVTDTLKATQVAPEVAEETMADLNEQLEAVAEVGDVMTRSKLAGQAVMEDAVEDEMAALEASLGVGAGVAVGAKAPVGVGVGAAGARTPVVAAAAGARMPVAAPADAGARTPAAAAAVPLAAAMAMPVAPSHLPHVPVAVGQPPVAVGEGGAPDDADVDRELAALEASMA